MDRIFSLLLPVHRRLGVGTVPGVAAVGTTDFALSLKHTGSADFASQPVIPVNSQVVKVFGFRRGGFHNAVSTLRGELPARRRDYSGLQDHFATQGSFGGGFVNSQVNPVEAVQGFRRIQCHTSPPRRSPRLLAPLERSGRPWKARPGRSGPAKAVPCWTTSGSPFVHHG